TSYAVESHPELRTRVGALYNANWEQLLLLDVIDANPLLHALCHGLQHQRCKHNSILSSLPYLTVWVLSFAVGFTSDWIINKGILTRTVSRKVFNSLGLFLPALSLVVLSYTRPDQPIRAVALLVAAVGSNAFHFSGFSVNHMDLSPNHAGVVMGLVNGCSQITGVVAPLVVQFVVTTPTDPLQWRVVFLIAAAFNVINATVFDVFGSAKVQPWNAPEEPQEIEKRDVVGK
ncbi:hypothetical protein YQE_03232, partial [Dendroctonus ponderosae]